jgi:hypothetical protein
MKQCRRLRDGGSKRTAPPTGGEMLKRQVRWPAALNQTVVARYYRGGVSHVRIVQIEAMAVVPRRIEIAYRAAVKMALLMRGRSTADLENLKKASSAKP